LTFGKFLIATALVALSFLGAPGSESQAGDTHNALIGTHNPTDLTVRYVSQWGEGEWEYVTIAPGERR
jgi:hypothetical protein